ncbi:LytTR family DNA-binding domain-containing protein [Spirosoma sp.]|uniref:LytTR family DNA-binding domain-containing protein n=1 Tax=Spirosoma sp. TaxID=1899569 RepID=UPI0025F37072|nr:LytTR family DNA-binding domain-containing protein [Spirosoma sp.]
MLSIVIVYEAVSWSIGYRIKIQHVANEGGVLPYISKFFRSIIIPESITVYITFSLINFYHRVRNISTIENSWRSIGRYELTFLPVFLIAFLFFNPITQTVRFFLEQYQGYTLNEYINGYILYTFTWLMYFKYLFPVLLIGYLALNISLLKDYLNQRKEAQEKAEADAAEAAQKYLELSETFLPKPTIPSKYLSYLKGKSNLGEFDFPVNEAYYFTVEERAYYAETIKERYMVNKTINELEAELDPSQFFRIKRDYIVNRQAVLHYSYWENGKYIVTLNNPGHHEIIVPRVRMQEFREWLQGRDSAGKPEPANAL